MKFRSICAVLFALSAGTLLCQMPDALAQGLDGTLRGQVRDSTGALVPGAVVTAKNNGTGAVRTVETSSAGTYAFTNLLVGNYNVSAELKGFKKYVRPSIDVRANQVVEVDMTLELGEVTAVVEVEGGADLVQTTSSQLASSISGRALTDLPNFGNVGDGSPYALAIVTPGVTTQGGGILGEGGAIGGNRPRNNNFTIDGVDNNRLDITGTAMPVIADAVQEFNLLTNQFSAEYGHSTAGQFNVITKSGTNEVHGSAFFLGNNRKLNAYDNLEKADLASGVLSDKRRYDFARTGGTLGGPIIKDKLFAFGAYQYQTLGQAATGSTAEQMTRQWMPYMELRPDVLAYIDDFSTDHGYPPVNLEIATRFGYSRAWASMFLDRLETDGLIVRARETGITRKRTIRLTYAGAREASKGMADGQRRTHRRSLATRQRP